MMIPRIWLLAALVFMLGQFGIPIAQGQAKPKKLNPYTGNRGMLEEGRKLYFYFGCNGCHGGEGGGGMAPGVPVIDDKWKFGSDDETNFKLFRGEIPGQTMPAYRKGNMTDEQLWKILAFVRSLYKGDPSRIDW